MPDTPRLDLVDAIRQALAAQADPDRAPAFQRYLKSSLPLLGLSMPTHRATMRRVLGDAAHHIGERDQWEATIRRLWHEAAYRDHWYAAIALARHPRYAAWRDPQALPLWRELVLTGAWWDVVDDIATHLVRDTLLDRPEQVAPVLRAWAHEDCVWVRRSAIIAQVGAKQRTDPDLLRDCIAPSLDDRDFFARKAIGWALRDHARTDPDWVRAYVAAHPHLSPLSRREALKHR